MTRPLLNAVLVLSLAVVSYARGDDVVSYLKKAAKAEATGKIEKESPEGLRLKTAKMNLDIPAADVLQVIYDQKKMTVAAFRPPFSALEKALTGPRLDPKELATIVKDLQRLLPQFRDSPAIDRHIQYSICQATVLQGRDDPQRKQEAIRLLDAFRAAHRDGWQLVPALKTLAELQQEKGDIDGALKTCEQLAAVAGAPRDIKIFADLQMGQLLMMRLALRGCRNALADLARCQGAAERCPGTGLLPSLLAKMPTRSE